MSLTPVKVEMLRYLAEMRFLSLPQLARLCCPSGRRDLSEKSTRRHMRALFDAGLVDVLPVSRAALAPAGTANDASLLYGSAPNVYAPTAHGLQALHWAGLISKEESKRAAPAYGPRNSLFLAHELAVRDVRVWLEESARADWHAVECWRDGDGAVIGVGQERAPFRVRPDAWFVYRMGGTVLVGLVELDRGTERGDRRWREKLEAYAALFDGGDLTRATGYRNARVLVFCPNARRNDQLCEIIAEADRPLASRFWVTEQTTLEETNLRACRWRRPDDSSLFPLLQG